MGKKGKAKKISSFWEISQKEVERAKVTDRKKAVAFFLSSREFTEAQLKMLPPEALSKESQFHFVVVNYHYEIDDWEVFVGVPVLMYAYKQTIGGASVDVERGVIAKAKEEAEKAISPLLEKVTPISFLGKEPKKISVSFLNSFHYHPSGMRRFSGSDLDTSLENFGICFPYGKGEYPEVIHYTGLAGIGSGDPYRMDSYIVSCREGETPLYEKIESFWIIPEAWEKEPAFFREGKRLVIGDTDLKDSVSKELWGFWKKISFPKELYFGKEEFFEVYTPRIDSFGSRDFDYYWQGKY